MKNSFKKIIYYLHTVDVPQHEAPVAEINEKTRYSPAILEIKPNVELTPGHNHHHTSTHETIYQPQKFSPSTEIQHPHGHKYYAETHHDYKPSEHVYKPGTVISVKHNPVPAVKKVKLISTSGLKHFATHHKIISRNDYQKYSKSQNDHFNQYQQENESEEEYESEEQQQFPSSQLKYQQHQQLKLQIPRRQNLYRRNPKNMYRYAPHVQNYRAI